MIDKGVKGSGPINGRRNLELVRNYFLEHPGVSQTQASKALGLSLSAVGRHHRKIYTELEEIEKRRLSLIYKERGRQLMEREGVPLEDQSIDKSCGLIALAIIKNIDEANVEYESHITDNTTTAQAKRAAIRDLLQRAIHQLHTLDEMVKLKSW